jgi:hypothetical protein
MSTSQNTNAAAGSTSKAKMIGDTDTTQPRAVIEEENQFPQSTYKQEIRNRAYEIYLRRGGEPGDELLDWFQAEQELTR